MTDGDRGRVELAVVVPTWNEAENLSLLLPALKRVIEAVGVAAEIIVADAGSTDGTAEVARRAGGRVIRQAGRGYGAGLLAGIEATAADDAEQRRGMGKAARAFADRDCSLAV